MLGESRWLVFGQNAKGWHVAHIGSPMLRAVAGKVLKRTHADRPTGNHAFMAMMTEDEFDEYVRLKEAHRDLPDSDQASARERVQGVG